MNTLCALAAGLTLAVGTVQADSQAFRAIVGDAANIERDASALARDLKVKRFDQEKVKSSISSLGNDIANLRKDVESLEGRLSQLTPQQKADWELIKTKVELLMVFYDRKTELMNGDPVKNRTMLRAHADGIAKRARMLQQTAARLDR